PSTMPASRAPVIATTFVVRFIFGLLSPRVIGYTPARWPARNPLRPRTRRPRVPCAVPSIEQLQKLLQAEPDDTFLLYALAQEQAKSGNLGDAIATYDRVIALDPGHAYAWFHKARAQE